MDYRTLIPFLGHCDLPSDEVKVELLTADRMLQSCRLDGVTLKNVHDVYQQLSTVPQGFTVLLRCLQIAMIFGITSATAKQSFSSLRSVKTYLRSTMTQERLSNLALLYIERELSSTLWDCLDEVVQSFAAQHKNSRMVLL